MYVHMVPFHTGTAIQFTPRFWHSQNVSTQRAVWLTLWLAPPVVSGCSLSQPEWIIHIVNPDHQMHAIWV